MAKKVRKDSKGRPLHKGEAERKSEHRYSYSFTDMSGVRRYIYDTDLMNLRRREKELKRDLQDGIKVYGKGNATLNDAFERYLETKYNLRGSTKSGYEYIYDHFVRDTIGKRRIKDIAYSDVVNFYVNLLKKQGISPATLDNIHCLLHPTFQMAYRDLLIRTNPTDGAISEVLKNVNAHGRKRHALSPEEQEAFIDFVAKSPVYSHWWALFTILLGTGCRIGEAIGLTWDNIDMEDETVTVNHTMTYYSNSVTKSARMHIHEPKTEAGIRVIPMISSVKEAFQFIKDIEEEIGPNEQEVDGYKGFVFQNRFRLVPNPQSVNRAIKRILNEYNARESLAAAKEDREPLLLPDFSCHNLRHTFITRLCEVEPNLKVVQYLSGHADIRTTMEIYAEATERRNRESIKALDEKYKKLNM